MIGCSKKFKTNCFEYWKCCIDATCVLWCSCILAILESINLETFTRSLILRHIRINMKHTGSFIGAHYLPLTKLNLFLNYSYSRVTLGKEILHTCTNIHHYFGKGHVSHTHDAVQRLWCTYCEQRHTIQEGGCMSKSYQNNIGPLQPTIFHPKDHDHTATPKVHWGQHWKCCCSLSRTSSHTSVPLRRPQDNISAHQGCSDGKTHNHGTLLWETLSFPGCLFGMSQTDLDKSVFRLGGRWPASEQTFLVWRGGHWGLGHTACVIAPQICQKKFFNLELIVTLFKTVFKTDPKTDPI